jgi:hypothetical protein
MDKLKDTVAQPTNGTLTPTEARAILETEAKARVMECQAEVQKVLDKYQCVIDVAVLLKANQVIPQVQIVARGA